NDAGAGREPAGPSGPPGQAHRDAPAVAAQPPRPMAVEVDGNGPDARAAHAPQADAHGAPARAGAARGRRARPERDRLRRVSERAPARTVLEGHPRLGALLADAGLGVVADTARERLAHRGELVVGERDAEVGVVGCLHRLAL